MLCRLASSRSRCMQLRILAKSEAYRRAGMGGVAVGVLGCSPCACVSWLLMLCVTALVLILRVIAVDTTRRRHPPTRREWDELRVS
jgi:hypothetical protein